MKLIDRIKKLLRPSKPPDEPEAEELVPHPRNVPGPFYIVENCCMTCMVIHGEAPALMGFDEEEHHCFVKQQPASAEEVYRAIRAVWASDVGCLRYGGQNPEILHRLAELGAEDVCDHPPPAGSGY